MERVEKKKWYLSKTIRLALAQAFIAVIAGYATQHPEVSWIGLAKSVADIWLRFETKQPVK